MKIHTDAFRCSKCEHRFSTNYNLTNHKCAGNAVSDHQGEEEVMTLFNCNECDAVLTNNEDFAEHMNKHEEEDEFEIEDDEAGAMMELSEEETDTEEVIEDI